jgi:hypothetical protein
LGLMGSADAPPRRWIDRLPDPSPDNYQHWGTMMPGNLPEPNNLNSPESCVMANVSQMYSGAWGWSDENCYMNTTVMCKIPRELRARPGVRPCQARRQAMPGHAMLCPAVLRRAVRHALLRQATPWSRACARLVLGSGRRPLLGAG